MSTVSYGTVAHTVVTLTVSWWSLIMPVKTKQMVLRVPCHRCSHYLWIITLQRWLRLEKLPLLFPLTKSMISPEYVSQEVRKQKIWITLRQICVLFFSRWYQSLINQTTSAGMAVHARLMQLSQEVDNIAHTSCHVPEKKSELENPSRFGTSATRQDDRKQEGYVRKYFF